MSRPRGDAAVSAAVALGLLAALFYGATDFAARFAGRRVGPLRTILYGHGAAALVMATVLLWRGIPPANAATWLATVASNLVGLAATASLYRALATGSLAVVSPIAAMYGGVAALLSAASGEALRPVAWLGLALAVAGSIAVARPRPGPDRVRTRRAGAFSAATAALLYGVSFWLQGRYVVPYLGVLAPTCSYYVLGCAAALAFGVLGRRPLAPPPKPAAPVVFGTTALACGGTLALAAGQVTGEVAVVTVLSALASAVTVLLARIVLKEPVPPWGWAGLALTVGGIGLLHAA